MDVRLPGKLAKYVGGKIKSGEFKNPEAVVAEALAQMQDAEALNRANIAQLRAAVQEGLDDLAAGRVYPLDKSTFNRIRARGQAKLARTTRRRSA
jgi:antitoxin ParD1/3/4